MAIPLRQTIRVGAYVLGQHLRGVRRYPLVLMLEPLFRCNLACAGCGKIDYPDAILNQRLSPADCLHAVDECGAPIVVLAGGEPLLHRDIGEIVRGILGRKKFVYLCTNALLLEKRLDQIRTASGLCVDCPSRRRSRRARSIGLPRRRLRARGGGNRRSEKPWVSRQYQCDIIRYRRARAGRALFRRNDRDRDRRHHGFAGLCL